MLGVLEIEENLFFRRWFDAKYLHQVSYLLDACKKPTSIVEKKLKNGSCEYNRVISRNVRLLFPSVYTAV